MPATWLYMRVRLHVGTIRKSVEEELRLVTEMKFAWETFPCNPRLLSSLVFWDRQRTASTESRVGELVRWDCILAESQELQGHARRRGLSGAEQFVALFFFFFLSFYSGLLTLASPIPGTSEIGTPAYLGFIDSISFLVGAPRTWK